MDEKNNQIVSLPSRGKIITAGIIFIGGFLSPLLIPIVTSSDLSAGWKAALSGLLVFGIPELFMLIAVAVAGKEGFNYIKSKMYGFLKKHGPPDAVSKTRYKLGLVLFLIPILVGLFLPYFTHLIPFYEEYRNLINAIGDIVLLTSLFVLGGDFWDKLRALFIYGANVILPTNKKSTDNEN